jgi:hypothetical protein
MLPSQLKSENFKSYAPEGRKLATENLESLRRLPLSFLPGMLREVIEYDYKFPAERRSLDKELANLRSLSREQALEWFQAFAQIKLSPALEHLDWVNSPAQFVEQLSSHLWTTHQLDAFRNAAIAYADRLRAAVPPDPPPAMARLGISVIGQGVAEYNEPLFRRMRTQGSYFSKIDPKDGLSQLLDAISVRAKSRPEPYAHWYIDGGEAATHDSALTVVSYRDLEPARSMLLAKMQAEVERPGNGPENLRTFMAQLRPADVGVVSGDAVMNRFQVKLLTEGSGTQIFSTSFAQWAAREALRRAQPLTLLVRFSLRQRQKPMNEMLFAKNENVEFDPVGSLVDGDMGAYYNWINQQRLPGAEQSSFLVWFEGHNTALAISPSLTAGSESTKSTDLRYVLHTMSA